MGNFLYSEIQSIALKVVKYFCLGGMAAIIDISIFFLYKTINLQLSACSSMQLYPGHLDELNPEHPIRF